MNYPFRFLLYLSVALLFGACSNSSTSDKLVETTSGPVSTDKALQAATEAIQKEPGDPQNFKKRAALYLDRKQYTEALDDVNRAIALDSTKGEFFYLKARALRGNSQVADALKNAHKAEQKGYADAGLYLAMGEMYLIFKEYQKAINYLNKSLEKAQFNEQAYYYKGLVYAESKDTTRAISSLQTAIEQNPSYIDAYNSLIKIYNAKKDSKLAGQYLLSALRFAPEDPFLHFNKGIFLRNTNHTDSAITSFQHALVLDSTHYLAAYNLGILAYEKENYELAADALRKAYAYDKQLPALESLLAYSYEQTGNYQLAQEYYFKALEKAPADKEINDGIKRIQAKLNPVSAKKP